MHFRELGIKGIYLKFAGFFICYRIYFSNIFEYLTGLHTKQVYTIANIAREKNEFYEQSCGTCE